MMRTMMTVDLMMVYHHVYVNSWIHLKKMSSLSATSVVSLLTWEPSSATATSCKYQMMAFQSRNEGVHHYSVYRSDWAVFACGFFDACYCSYHRYLTFRDVPKEELEYWKDSVVTFYKKVLFKHREKVSS